MATERLSYVPDGRGGFVRYSYARRTPSSNRLVELGRLFYNLIRGILQFFNLLHYSLTTFNNMIQSLPFCIRYFVQVVLAFCFPFYAAYQAFVLMINRIYRVTNSVSRIFTLITRLFTFVITLPLRIFAFLRTLAEDLFKNLLKLAIVTAIIVGILALVLDEQQLNLIKAYAHNVTNMLLKSSSTV
ncbi:unnamed protein product [Adineta ricciae]|uniref:Uncharacterized protein n=1 Tax=Adineta ricciae TaxID=249248 RepID=A0A816DVE3_ADIRI|nr:unnamed protein product [Adineta ricciae]